MNEQIRLLAKQAGYVRHFEFSETQLEKFAALIIEECANIALREDHDPYECILKHFGVGNETNNC